MAEASLIGLVAAVALPLAYAQAVHLGWPLVGVLAGAVGSYLIVATGLGHFHPTGAVKCLTIASIAILVASYLASWISITSAGRGRVARSGRWTKVIRTAIPAAYVIVVGIASTTASPSWAGLISTFPSMSVAILAVTHLEEGPVEASLIAKTLPAANLSTVAFLAAFRFGSPAIGLGWGTFGGYVAALFCTALIELAARRITPRRFTPGRDRQRRRTTRGVRPSPRRAGIRIDGQAAPRHFARPSPNPRRRFAPLVEALPC
jgi:hypothetical protein